MITEWQININVFQNFFFFSKFDFFPPKEGRGRGRWRAPGGGGSIFGGSGGGFSPTNSPTPQFS